MDYKKLEIWVQARELVERVNDLTKTFSNDAIRFLHIAKGSLFERDTQLIVASDSDYLVLDVAEILSEIERVKKMLNGFINCRKKL